MVYLGSKSKYAGTIVPILQHIIDTNNIEIYIEPFTGGSNIIDKIHCKNKYGYDKNKYLIALHKQLQSNPNIIQEQSYTREEWDLAKAIYRGEMNSSLMEDWKIGAIIQFCSFNTRGFPGGYVDPSKGRDYITRRANALNQANSNLYKDIIFDCIDYTELNSIKGALVYCDPPYQDTKTYGYVNESKFDYSYYWNWIRELSKDNIVICSEQKFPDDFQIIWEQQVKRTVHSENNFKAVEKLGTLNNNLTFKK